MSKSVFISFENDKDKDSFDSIKGLIENPNINVSFNDKSVRKEIDSTNENRIRKEIREKIKSASVLLCIVGKDTHSSRWVKWEIETARQNNKKVFFMRKKDDLNSSMPRDVLGKDVVINWSIKFLQKL